MDPHVEKELHDPGLRSILRRAWRLAHIHLADHDELGELAHETLALLKYRYGDFKWSEE